MDEYGTYLSLRGIQMDKEVSLAAIRELHKREWESEEDIPYAQSIYKMIDEVIEYDFPWVFFIIFFFEIVGHITK